MQIIIKKTSYGRIGRTELYAYHNKKAKRSTIRIKEKGSVKTYTGNFFFGNRIFSGNGKMIHDQQDLNTLQAANKNLLSVFKTGYQLYQKLWGKVLVSAETK